MQNFQVNDSYEVFCGLQETNIYTIHREQSGYTLYPLITPLTVSDHEIKSVNSRYVISYICSVTARTDVNNINNIVE